MAERKKKKSRIFDDNYAPYGTYDTSHGYGNPDEWAEAFKERFSEIEISEIIGEDDPWAILGVRPGTTQDQIRTAFRKRALETHPDRNHGKDGSEFRKVKAAFDKLTT